MLKFNTAEIVRIVENTKGLDNEDVVLAMLEDDDVVTSTMTVTVSNQDLITEPLTVPEWGWYINEEYPGWTILHLSNKE